MRGVAEGLIIGFGVLSLFCLAVWIWSEINRRRPTITERARGLMYVGDEVGAMRLALRHLYPVPYPESDRAKAFVESLLISNHCLIAAVEPAAAHIGGEFTARFRELKAANHEMERILDMWMSPRRGLPVEAPVEWADPNRRLATIPEELTKALSQRSKNAVEP